MTQHDVSPLRLPQDLSELTADWLTSALATSRPGVEVTSLHFGTVQRGTGTKIRLLLSYNDAGHSWRLPATMLAKCGFEAHSHTAHVASTARSEVVFYRQRAPLGLVNVPKCYFAGSDEKSGASFLLLEDLLARNVRFGTALRPIADPRTVRLGVEMLARYHARWWNSPELKNVGPPIVADAWAGFILDEKNFEQCRRLPRFEFVPPWLRSREQFRDVLTQMWDGNTRGPQCIVHGDLHLGNCYFEPDGTPGFLDWQGDTRGCWAHDFTEFLLTSLDVDTRRACERDMIEYYLQQLRLHGAEAPSFASAWQQYRRNTFWVGCASAVCPDNMQPESCCIAYTQRGMAAIADLNAMTSFEERTL